MNSFIFAYKSTSQDVIENDNIDLYINFFKKDRDIYLKEYVYIDVGIKIKNISNVKDFIIILPFICLAENIVDLYGSVTEDKFLNVLYNSSILTKLSDTNFCTFKFVNEREEFFSRVINYMKIDKEGYVNHGSMTFLTIDVEGVVNEIKESPLNSEFKDMINFRFRIKTNRIGEIVKRVHNNKFVNVFSPSEYTVIQTFDFRFNYIRSLNQNILTYLNCNKLHLYKFDKIRFSAIEPIECTIESYGDTNCGARILEDGIWDNYIGNDKRYIHNMISYAWDILGNKVEKFQVMYKRSCRKNNITLVIIYICLTILVGVLASFLASAII